MTNEEFEHFKESFRAQMEGSSPPRVLLEETAERRKLSRDMDRLERVLKKIVAAPRAAKNQSGKQRIEPEKAYEKRRAEMQEIRARSDAKLKALMEELQIPRDRPPRP